MPRRNAGKAAPLPSRDFRPDGPGTQAVRGSKRGPPAVSPCHGNGAPIEGERRDRSEIRWRSSGGPGADRRETAAPIDHLRERSNRENEAMPQHLAEIQTAFHPAHAGSPFRSRAPRCRHRGDDRSFSPGPRCEPRSPRKAPTRRGVFVSGPFTMGRRNPSVGHPTAAPISVSGRPSRAPPHDRERGRQLCRFLCQVWLVLIPCLHKPRTTAPAFSNTRLFLEISYGTRPGESPWSAPRRRDLGGTSQSIPTTPLPPFVAGCKLTS